MEQHSHNLSELAGRVIAIRPDLPGHEDVFRGFCKLLSALIRASDNASRFRALRQAREEIESMGAVSPTKREIALKFACSIIVDVVAQGWEIRVTRARIELQSPRVDGVSPEEQKRRLREGHMLERDSQLREPSVREFIKNMEQRRLGPGGWASIFSLMRDGRELARQLKSAGRESNEAKRLTALKTAVSPYLQAVEAGAVCEFTGLKLTDIWRYFRHTWVSTYKSLPGRSMTVLVRDAAAPNHPVIGIAALGSSMAQQTLRDRWIGWDSDLFEKNLTAGPTARLARWILESVERLIDSIYFADFLSEGIVERRELKRPTEHAIKRLLRESIRASEDHRRFPGTAEHKGNGADVDWRKRATTALFRFKRAKTFALLLGIRASLTPPACAKRHAVSLKQTVAKRSGRHAIRQLVRLVKAEHVGVDMMDIIICGAVAPYNTLLGGKLICLL